MEKVKGILYYRKRNCRMACNMCKPWCGAHSKVCTEAASMNWLEREKERHSFKIIEAATDHTVPHFFKSPMPSIYFSNNQPVNVSVFQNHFTFPFIYLYLLPKKDKYHFHNLSLFSVCQRQYIWEFICFIRKEKRWLECACMRRNLPKRLVGVKKDSI